MINCAAQIIDIKSIKTLIKKMNLKTSSKMCYKIIRTLKQLNFARLPSVFSSKADYMATSCTLTVK